MKGGVAVKSKDGFLLYSHNLQTVYLQMTEVGKRKNKKWKSLLSS